LLLQFFILNILNKIKKFMNNIFTKHPKEFGYNYFQHLWGAWKYCLTLLGLLIIAFVHSILPFTFKETVSKKIVKMADEHKKMTNSSKIHQ
jgi:ABC-type lipoprotein release transport system permease subunit